MDTDQAPGRPAVALHQPQQHVAAAAAVGAAPPSSPAGTDCGSPRYSNDTTLLEGWLLKQGSRVQFWHERYFRFTSDHRLEYSVNPDAPAKASIQITELADLKVSELYVSKHKHTMVYSVKLTWTSSSASGAAHIDSMHEGETTYAADDDDSFPGVLSRGGGGGDDNASEVRSLRSQQLPPRQLHLNGNPHDADLISGVSESVVSATAGGGTTTEELLRPRGGAGARTPFERFRRRSHFSHRNHGWQVSEGRSIDQESLTMGTRRIRNSSQQHQHPSRRDGGAMGTDEHVIPQEVQVDPRHALVGPPLPPPESPQRTPLIRNSSSASAVPIPPPAPPLAASPVMGTPTSTTRRSNRATINNNNNKNNHQQHNGAGGGNHGDHRDPPPPPPPDSGRLRTAYERQRDEDLEFLRSEYNTRQQERKKRVRQRVANGTKIAVATGAAVGVTIVTAGIGLVAGLVFLGVGAAAGGGSAAVATTWRAKVRGELVLASDSYETIRIWKALLDASKDTDSIKRSTWGQLFVSDGRKSNVALLPRTLVFAKESNRPEHARGDSRALNLGDKATWIPLEGGWISILGCGHGMRIFREDDADGFAASAAATTSTPKAASGGSPLRRLLRNCLESRTSSPMKAHLVINASPLDAFLCLMSFGLVNLPPESSHLLEPVSEQSSAFCVVESVDDHTDIIHLVYRPLYLLPTWTNPRDFCLFRYWRLEQDGSYVVCYESIDHPKCPPVPNYVRGEMHQVVTIAPQKISYRRRTLSSSTAPPPVDCLMTAVAQVDPRGWVSTKQLPFLSNQCYADAFTITTLSRVREIRDAIDQDRFMPAFVESGEAPGPFEATPFKKVPSLERNNSLDDESVGGDDTPNYDYAYASREASRRMSSGAELDLVLNPPPLTPEKWAEPDPNSFRVRGPSYKTDRLKINAGTSIGRLVAADVIWSESPIYSGFTVHPTERLQRALRKEKLLLQRGRHGTMPPFVFVVTIVLPGPPYYYGVYYFAVDDLSTIDGSDGSPSSILCNQFFFGESDQFRDRTFKMIPQIVQGNFIVRKAVGDTPAIMGTKLRQLYVKGDRFFEVILDCGSSSVATGVIRLSLSYAKMLVIDMGFLFEGDEPSTLPERLFGAVRMKQVEFGPHLRKVEPPPVSTTS